MAAPRHGVRRPRTDVGLPGFANGTVSRSFDPRRGVARGAQSFGDSDLARKWSSDSGSGLTPDSREHARELNSTDAALGHGGPPGVRLDGSGQGVGSRRV